jgi:cytochrome c oxidase subunit II
VTAGVRGAWIALMVWPIVSVGQSPNIQRGERIYDICGACHGTRAQGDQTLKAPPLAGQQRSYLLRQLRNFHSGVRGDKADVQAREMQDILKTVAAEGDWQSVIDFVMTLPLPRSHEVSDGDVTRGREIYGTCASCHGSAGEGNEALEAPSLAQLPSWYIVEQLQKFRAGSRGAGTNDGPGNRMRAIARTSQFDKDIAPVTAYIVDKLRR